MDAAHLHLMLVHLPVVGAPLALTGWLLAWKRGEAFWERLFIGLWILVAASAGAAYFSGGAAFEALRLAAGVDGWGGQATAESHAVTARAAALSLLLSAAALAQVPLARLQGHQAGKGPRIAAFILGVAACLLLFLAAWQGGPVGHAELR